MVGPAGVARESLPSGASVQSQWSECARPLRQVPAVTAPRAGGVWVELGEWAAKPGSLALSRGRCPEAVWGGAAGPDLACFLPPLGLDPSVLSHVLEGHGDAVWGLAFSPTSQRLASCSADGTIRIWDPSSSSPTCLCTFLTASGESGEQGWARGGRGNTSQRNMPPHEGPRLPKSRPAAPGQDQVC